MSTHTPTYPPCSAQGVQVPIIPLAMKTTGTLDMTQMLSVSQNTRIQVSVKISLPPPPLENRQKALPH